MKTVKCMYWGICAKTQDKTEIDKNCTVEKSDSFPGEYSFTVKCIYSAEQEFVLQE